MVRNKEKGITMWGMLMIALIVAFFALLVIKLVPTYLMDLKVKSALEGVSKQSQQSNMTNYEIREALRKRFEVDQIQNEMDAKRDVEFVKRGRSRYIRIKYEVLTPMVGNLSILVQFDHEAEAGKFE